MRLLLVPSRVPSPLLTRGEGGMLIGVGFSGASLRSLFWGARGEGRTQGAPLPPAPPRAASRGEAEGQTPCYPPSHTLRVRTRSGHCGRFLRLIRLATPSEELACRFRG